MVRTLVIGDLHYVDKPKGMMKAQTDAIIQICAEAKGCSRVIFLGDVFMHRRPSPAVLLEVKRMISCISEDIGYEVHILRGNHDSMTKADDGVTALSLMSTPNVHVHTRCFTDHRLKYKFIPHYEDQERIRRELKDTPRGYTVFGHFGFYGVLNSVGDMDFSLAPSDFKNRTILGHIHKEATHDNIHVLGTPYTTNFGEANKNCYYGILTDDEFEKHPIDYGPRHVVMDYDKVQPNLEWLNHKTHKSQYTLLRIKVNSLDEGQVGLADLYDKLDVEYVDVKYKPLLDEKEEYVPDVDISSTSITNQMIEHYINSSKTSINKDNLLEGLELIYENQQSRDN